MQEMEHENYSIFVKKYDFNKSDIHNVNIILNDTTKKFRYKHFPSFNYTCQCDIKFMKNVNNQEFNIVVTLGNLEFENQGYGLNQKNSKKVKNLFLKSMR